MNKLSMRIGLFVTVLKHKFGINLMSILDREDR